MIKLTTNKGVITLELDHEKAPITAANFEQYVKDGFYDGVIFHRVIKGFMIQGGGMTPDMGEKATRDSIQNEAQNGLKKRQIHHRHGAYPSPAFRIRPVLYQYQRQRLPQPHLAQPARLGLCRIRQSNGRFRCGRCD